jgi:FKBP-type peptidyl-prolyl cis-trans isomerase
VSEVSKKSSLARKREAQEAKRRRKRRLITMGAVAVIVVAAVIGTIVYFAVRNEGPARVAAVGDKLSVYYTLWLEDGTQIESNVGGTPFKFTLGQGDVIKGWDEGLVGMKVGETRTLTIPPDRAYGEAGSPPKIPPNATLTYEVELLAVE